MVYVGFETAYNKVVIIILTSDSYMVNIMLKCFIFIFNLILRITEVDVIYSHLFMEQENWRLEELSSFPKVAQLISGIDQIKSSVC